MAFSRQKPRMLPLDRHRSEELRHFGVHSACQSAPCARRREANLVGMAKWQRAGLSISVPAGYCRFNIVLIDILGAVVAYAVTRGLGAVFDVF